MPLPAPVPPPQAAPPAPPPSAPKGGSYAFFVAAGILLSRLAGLVRDRTFAHYFGNGDVADALRAAFRIPNLLQNLFGEGVLSASFIPVYASLLGRGEREEADRLASAVAALLALISSVLVLVGVLLTPQLIDLVAPGFHGEKRELTITLVRVFFPGAGLLVLSAWCLGILNSHRRFFLSYAAPVIWNASIVGAVLGFGRHADLPRMALIFAWGSVVGSLLQILVQLPAVLRVAAGLRAVFDVASTNVRTVIRNFVPVFIGRGVFQISGYVDQIIATFLPTGAVAILGSAQTLYMLPVSLFGMSVSAAELPAMSSALGDDTQVAEYLRKRLDGGLRQIAYFVVPSAMAFLALGDVVGAALYQTGKFTRADSVYLWGVLAGSSVGLVATTLGRLYSSTYYALRDTRTPLRFALIRVALTMGLGYLCALQLPGLLGVEARWGTVGLTASAGIAGWVEFGLLRRRLNRRIGQTGLPLGFTLKLWTLASLGAAGAWAVKLGVGPLHPIMLAVLVLGAYGVVYVGGSVVLQVPEAQSILARAGRLTRRFRKRRS